MDPGFALVKRDLIKLAAQKGLSDRSFKVLVAIMTFANPTSPEAWPSEETISEMTGDSLRTVKRAVAELQEKLGIKVTKRMTPSGWPGNVYRLENAFEPKPEQVEPAEKMKAASVESPPETAATPLAAAPTALPENEHPNARAARLLRQSAREALAAIGEAA